MNYELAKKLKDAGFPQNVEHGHHFYYDSMPNTFIIKNAREQALNEPITKRPTLSELIEACGEEFDYLEKNGTEGWLACDAGIYGQGDTPEIAVANLWLALNTK